MKGCLCAGWSLSKMVSVQDGVCALWSACRVVGMHSGACVCTDVCVHDGL